MEPLAIAEAFKSAFCIREFIVVLIKVEDISAT